MTVTSLSAPVDRRPPRTGSRRRDVVDPEQLPVDPLGRPRPARAAPPIASVTIPNGPHSHQWSTAATSISRGSSVAQLGRVEPAAEQVGLARLAGQQVHQFEPGRVAVLQVGQLLGEHHRVGAPVAVQDAHRGRRRVPQHGRRDRQHRGDPGPGRDQHVPAAGVEVGGERAGRRRRPRPRRPARSSCTSQRGEQPAGHLAHADPRRRARPARRSSTMRRSSSGRRRPPHGQRLPGPEGVAGRPARPARRR